MQYINKQLLSYRIGLIFILSIVACSQSINPSNYVERGSQNVFQPGHPEFYVSAVGLFDENNNSGIQVYIDLIYTSLVFKEKNNEEYGASVTAYIDIQKLDGQKKKLISDRFEITSVEKRDDPSKHNISKHYPASPGKYKIEVTLIDNSSSKSTTLITETFIPIQKGSEPHLTNIQLYGIDLEKSGKYEAITTYDIPARYDSLKLVYQVTNNKSGIILTIDSELIKFLSDDEPARSMGRSNYSSSSLHYKGIEYDEWETMQTNQRKLSQQGSVLIEYKFAMEQRGNYRFRVNIKRELEAKGKTAIRDFSVKSKNFPLLLTAEELARPLYYIMSKKEYDELMSLNSDDAIKNKIDRFWLRNIGNKQEAAQVIELYYSRVETANKLFSNYKEGWKTDRGMIYILFGPPLYKDQKLNSLQWFYSYNRGNSRTTFSFERPKSVNKHFPFSNYLLERAFFYNNVEYQQKRLWLSGSIRSIRI